MNNMRKLGANIRSLRKAYGETQEELGAVINVEKNTISYYENGKREPNRDILAAIARHYMISVEELMFGDLSSIGVISVDISIFWKNIDTVFPIISTEASMKNEHFERAYKYHKTFYNELHNINMDNIDYIDDIDSINYIDVCLEEYYKAYEDENIKPEAAVNIIAIWSFMLMMVKASSSMVKNRTAAFMQVVAGNPKIRRLVSNLNTDFEKEAKKIVAELEDFEIVEMLDELKTIIKHSPEWNDLAYYYIAISYMCNIIGNNLECGFNQRIGIEMLLSFASIGNIYAGYFLKNIVGLSSQNVNDR